MEAPLWRAGDPEDLATAGAKAVGAELEGSRHYRGLYADAEAAVTDEVAHGVGKQAFSEEGL